MDKIVRARGSYYRKNPLCIDCSAKLGDPRSLRCAECHKKNATYLSRCRAELYWTNMSGERQCRVCGQTKSFSEFKSRSDTGRPVDICKKCEFKRFKPLIPEFREKLKIERGKRQSTLFCIICSAPLLLPRRTFCEACSEAGIHDPRDLTRLQFRHKFFSDLKAQIPKSFDHIVELFQPIVLTGRSHHPSEFSVKFRIPCGMKEARQLFNFSRSQLGATNWPRYHFDYSTVNWPLLFLWSLHLHMRRLIFKLRNKNKPGQGPRKEIYEERERTRE